MKTPLYLTTALTCAMTGAMNDALAEDPSTGQSLHDRSCVACHDSQVYTRPNRRVTDLDGLAAQVDRCETNLGLLWFDEQKGAVVDYLNDSYYHF